MTTTAYKSPKGRVMVYDGCGRRIGGAEVLGTADRQVENAAWIDALPTEEDEMSTEKNEVTVARRRARRSKVDALNERLDTEGGADLSRLRLLIGKARARLRSRLGI